MASNKSGKASEATILNLTKNMTTSLSDKKVEDQSITRILMLLSTTSGSRRQESQQERSIAMLEALEIPFELLNCAMPENTELRDQYFELSGVRGDFPQFFLLQGSEPAVFLGQFDDIETINEKSNWPKSTLGKDDKTWDSIMGTTGTYNGKGISLEGPDGDDVSSDGSAAGGGIYADL